MADKSLYKVPVVSDCYWELVTRQSDGMGEYLLSGEISLGEKTVPSKKVKVEFDIPYRVYEKVKKELEDKAPDARIYVNNALEVSVGVRSMN